MGEASGDHIRHPTRHGWAIGIERDLEPYVRLQSSSRKHTRSIFRVKPRLRESLPEQFVPQHLCLGLYNRTGYKDAKTRGNSFRWAVVGAFLADSRMTVNNWEEVCGNIVTDPKAMLEEYNGVSHLSLEDVRNVLSLDAIFLACYLCTLFGVGRMDDHLSSVNHVVSRESDTFHDDLMIDIVIKLENQVPLELMH